MARIVTVGAGIAGVLASRALQEDGHDVTVLDKGYRPGGRMATRHLDGATFDHGAQFLTTRDPRFGAIVAELVAAGQVTTWFSGSPDAETARAAGTDTADGHPRYRGTAGMRPVVEHLAAPLHVVTQARVEALRWSGDVWEVHLDDGRRHTADAVLCTAPVPQTLDLLAGGARLDGDTHDRLAAIAYDPCIAVLAVPDRPPSLPHDGALRLDDEPLAWLADSQAKGISTAPGVTLHAGPETSRRLWDAPDEEVAAHLGAAAAPYLGTTVRAVRVHRWRYSRPTTPPVPGDGLVVTTPGPVAFAGDGFAGGRVEGAATSGLATAGELSRLLARAG